MSAVVDISDAVVASLAAASLPLPITAVRAYQLRREIRFDGVRVLVIPDLLALNARDMKPSLYLDWRIAVWVQAVCSGAVEEVDPLMELLEEIAVLFAFKILPGHVARCVAAESVPPIDTSTLDAKGLFLSGLYLTFRSARV